MKEVTKTITVFEAEDGTCFENEEKCARYEEQLRYIEFFKVLYNPDLTETGNLTSCGYFVVYSKYGCNKDILEQYLQKELDWDLIGTSVMGYGLQLHYHITTVERSEMDVKKLTVLSPIELDWYPKDKNKIQYFDYMKAWNLK
jgi:hypothetical protein